MVQITTFLTAIAALSGAAFAVICTSSETYCGARLLRVDSSNRKAVKAALAVGKQPTDDAHVNQSVFWCVPTGVPAGDAGLLFVTFCGPTNVCQEGGALGGVGDACAPMSGTTVLPRFR